MVSETRHQEQCIRQSLLEIMAIRIKREPLENLKLLGEVSATLKERIATRDYSNDDRVLNKIQSWNK